MPSVHFLLSVAALALASSALALSTTHKHGKRALDATSLATRYFGNDAPWYKNRIPFFECSDSQIQDTYYYRWQVFRAHQRDIGQRGYVSTGGSLPTSF
jgi:hypothetical protein